MRSVIVELDGGRIAISSKDLEKIATGNHPENIIPVALYLGQRIGVDLIEEGKTQASTVLTTMLREAIGYTKRKVQ